MTESPALGRVRERLAAEVLPPEAGPSPRRQVRELVLVLSSSRGGSSYLLELLQHSPQLLHLRAEINPFLRLCGLAFPDSGSGSDALDASHAAAAAALDPYLRWEIGERAGGLSGAAAPERFSRDLYGRLLLQWPCSGVGLEEVRGALTGTLEELAAEPGWGGGGFPDARVFHARFLRRLTAVHPEIDPYLYDLPPSLLRAVFPDRRPRRGPPPEPVIEETPFVTLHPWRPARELDRPLVIKTPSNAFRLEFFRALFPHARLRLLHLIRNPAAVINGLWEGWRHRGFFSHRVPRRLHLEGYSDVLSAWSESWWNFDLPPGWEERCEGSLWDLCGYQWRTAHEAVLDFLARHPSDCLRVRFEDLVSSPASRARALHDIVGWLGIGVEGLEEVIARGLPPIMVTSKPGPRRWHRRRRSIEPVLADARIRTMVENLGYERDPSTWL